ncbi:MAG: glycerol-3-phosphate acyltransferase [Anaerolineales bacterium]|nr:glycerol-3-phosphate acyltransferase [Anaerolineales bacterium]
MKALFLILFSFVCGALPFSFWLGKVILRQDIRLSGDGNPGAWNVFRSGNKYAGLLALLLDISKAAAPVGWIYHHLNIRGVPMFLIAIAPVLGHAYSPFLKFRGGKAIAAAFGVWIGLTLWRASLPAVLAAMIGVAFLTPPGWSVLLALMVILITLVNRKPDALFLAVWGVEVILLGWKHRGDLRQPPQLRSWVKKTLLHN